MKSVDAILAVENRRYISPKMYEEYIDKGWRFEEFPFGGGPAVMAKLRGRIVELLTSNKVCCAWMATSVRGYHNNHIIYKPL